MIGAQISSTFGPIPAVAKMMRCPPKKIKKRIKKEIKTSHTHRTLPSLSLFLCKSETKVIRTSFFIAVMSSSRLCAVGRLQKTLGHISPVERHDAVETNGVSAGAHLRQQWNAKPSFNVKAMTQLLDHDNFEMRERFRQFSKKPVFVLKNDIPLDEEREIALKRMYFIPMHMCLSFSLSLLKAGSRGGG